MKERLREWLELRIIVLGHFQGPRVASWFRKLRVKLLNPRAKITFGRGCRLGKGFSLYAPWGGTFTCGDYCEFRMGFRAEMVGPDTRIEIGDGCVFTYYSLVQCAGTMSIGDRVMFGQSSMVVDGNHRFRDLDTPMLDQGYDLREIRIEDDVTTTTKCTIIANIGKRTFVGANSVVSRDLPAYCVAIGAPARVVDYFGPPGEEPAELASSQASRK